jgi:autotransporter-associated beta strand protein
VEVDASDNYVIQGDGKIIGSGSLRKSGTGKLTLTGTNEYEGATVINGGILAVETLPNLVYAGSIGFPSNDPEMFILNGATFTSTGKSLVSGRAMKIGEKGGTIDANIGIDWDKKIVGGTLTKTGSSRLSFFSPDNNIDKLVIKAGTVELRSEGVSPGRTVVFEGGTLKCFSDQGSYSVATYDMEAPKDKSGTIILDDRCDYRGKLTGGGRLIIQSNWIRSDLSGNWSDFEGVIAVTTDNDGGDLRFNNNYGLAKAELNITGNLSVYNNAGTAFSIGALTGSASATLTNENWTVGARNTPVTTFSGLITGNSLTKVGTGALKLTNANTYSGNTTINGGYVLAMNSNGSATGTGNVAVNNNGSVGGNGIIGGNTSVYSGGKIEPGDPTATSWLNKIGTLTFEKNLTSAGTIKLSVRNAPGYLSDKLVVKGTATFSGNLEIEIVNGSETFSLGAELTLFNLQGAVNGQFATMILPVTAEGTKWDTDNLYTTGKIKVVNATGIDSPEAGDLYVYPNPAGDFIMIDLPEAGIHRINILNMAGNAVLETKAFQGRIDISSLPQGMYLLQLKQIEKVRIYKFVKTF